MLILDWYARPDEAHLSTILGWVKSHRNAEAAVGRSIWPASDIMASVRPKDGAAENCKSGPGC